MTTRRAVLRTLALAGASAPWLAPRFAYAGVARPRHVLLRSSWQTVNIGDVAHTPGALRLLDRYLPGTQVTLWPTKVDNGVREMLEKAFPRLKVAEGSLDADGAPGTPALREAFESADLMVHGSGPSVVARQHLAAWSNLTRKPYGIYGVTIGGEIDAEFKALLSAAAFVYCRDTRSLDVIKAAGVSSPVMEFGPDATFALDLRDDPRAATYLKAAGLADRQFLCAIPRLRYTPHYRIREKAPTDADRQHNAINEQFREADHAKLREAIVMWVRQTGLKVLACAEMTYEVELAKQVLVDPLPADVRGNVVWRDTYWRPDEAASVYARAAAVASFEMHSPIIAAAAGTPALYLREPTDTSKGQMWRDVGLKDWIFEIDDATGEQVGKQLLAIHAGPSAAAETLARAMAFVRTRQKETMAVVARAAGVTPAVQ